jgi:hypothetical protein
MDQLAAVRTPTLVMHGELDMMSPLENGRILATGIPGARLEVFPGGHAFPYEQPDETTRVLLDWFAANAGPTAAPAPSTWARRPERWSRPLAAHFGLLRNLKDLAYVASAAVTAWRVSE